MNTKEDSTAEKPAEAPSGNSSPEGHLLLHACCGPCALEPVRLLQEQGENPVIYYCNPNISPADEYERRLKTLQDFAASCGTRVVEGSQDRFTWERTVGRIGQAAHDRFGLIADPHAAAFARACKDDDSAAAKSAPELPGFQANVGDTSAQAQAARAARCRACYRVRFQEAARYAAEHGFTELGTTLSVSPYQHTQIIKEELERAAKQTGIQARFEDYRPLYGEATAHSKQLGMYRQNYCGCRFSEEEAAAERTARKQERKHARVRARLADAMQQASRMAESGTPYVDPAYPNGAYPPDPIPNEQAPLISQGAADEPHRCRFRAFDTIVDLAAYGSFDSARAAFTQAAEACRAFERRLSPWLAHSDIARLNASKGAPCPVHPQTAALLAASKHYCERSCGTFDVTMGPVIRLWDFRLGRIPAEDDLRKALEHVDWRKLNVFQLQGRWFAHLADAQASVNLGGIAKGWIADHLAVLMMQSSTQGNVSCVNTPDTGQNALPNGKDAALEHPTAAGRLTGVSVNLGGNVLVRGGKPNGNAWRIGIRNPQAPERLIGSVSVQEGSVVTSGTYERCFERDGQRYHHILDTTTGFPVRSDLAGASVAARSSLDAEGYSTTLLALGRQQAMEFMRAEPSILAAVLVGVDGTVTRYEKDAAHGRRRA